MKIANQIIKEHMSWSNSLDEAISESAANQVFDWSEFYGEKGITPEALKAMDEKEQNNLTYEALNIMSDAYAIAKEKWQKIVAIAESEEL